MRARLTISRMNAEVVFVASTRLLIEPEMDVRFPGLARLASSSQHPTGNGEDWAFPHSGLEELSDCFSEIDTESSTPESNRIAYLEQLLRLREPRHLSETQHRARRFVLDMLRLLCLLPEKQQAQASKTSPPRGWNPEHPFKYLVYLLDRTAQPSLSTTVSVAGGISGMDEAGILQLREWIFQQGLDAYELALIQPNFFQMGVAPQEGSTNSLALHPMFAELNDATRSRNHDYLSRAFYAASRAMVPAPETDANQSDVQPQAGLEEAMSSIFETPEDLLTATQTRLKAVFIPNGNGEPLVALSFVND